MRINTLDMPSRKVPFLVGPFCCILCRSSKVDVDHLFWSCDYALFVWNHFFGVDNIQLA